MKEKYFEDLGLDDGIDILERFKIDIDEILDSDEKREESNKVENHKNENK